MDQPAKRVRLENLRSLLLDFIRVQPGSHLLVSHILPNLNTLDLYALVRAENDRDGIITRYVRQNNVWQQLFDREFGHIEVNETNNPKTSLSTYIRSVFSSSFYPNHNPLWASLSYIVYNNLPARFGFATPGNDDYVEIIDTGDYYEFHFYGIQSVNIYRELTGSSGQNIDHTMTTTTKIHLATILRRVYQLFRKGMRLTHLNNRLLGIHSKGISCSVCDQDAVYTCNECNGSVYCSKECHTK